MFSLPLNSNISPKEVSIIWTLRVPRVLLAFLVGGSLAVSGSVVQSVLKNEFNLFIDASNTIEYNKVVNKVSKSAEEQLCLNQISTHATILAEYNKILSDLKGYMGV